MHSAYLACEPGCCWPFSPFFWLTCTCSEHGAPHDRSRAIDVVIQNAPEYSMDQYASKVVEKCLKVGGNEFLDRYLDRVCEGRADRPRIPLIDSILPLSPSSRHSSFADDRSCQRPVRQLSGPVDPSARIDWAQRTSCLPHPQAHGVVERKQVWIEGGHALLQSHLQQTGSWTSLADNSLH